MPTPSMPLHMVRGQITNAVREQREQAERALITGESIKEWPQTRLNPVAHKHFRRIVSLYRKIEKNDALIEPVLNRYCLMQAECEDFEAKREESYNMAIQLREMIHQGDKDTDTLDIIGKIDKLYQTALSFDRQVQAKRKMLLDIEKENIMTLAAQLRSVPKKPLEKESAPSGVGAFQKRKAQ